VACLGKDRADVSKRARTDAASHSQAAACSVSASATCQALEQLAEAGIEIVPTAAGADEAAAETVAAEQGGEVEEVAADLSAGRGRGQEGDVVGQRAEVAGVVGQPLEFQGDGAQPLRAQRGLVPARASSTEA
jgi:hypothetical protein